MKDEFWNSTVEEIKCGYKENKDSYNCLICNEEFTKGRIYEIDGRLYDAIKATEIHITEKHNSMLQYLLNLNSAYTSISDVQKEVLFLVAQGLSDKEIAAKLGVASSTIRNHKYKLREKEKQARLFLATMELLKENTNRSITKLDNEEICDAHKSATTLDDRFNITDKEKLQVVKNYMTPEGAIKTFPSKEKKKIIILEEIMNSFTRDRFYTEKEINKTLKRIFDDYVTIRRSLIEYGFLDRSDDCSKYWVKE